MTVGSQLASLTLSNGALQTVGVGDIDGLQFVNTLSGIGGSTSVQSVSNEVGETPEPQAVVLLGIGLLFLILIVRRSFVRA